MSSTVLYFLLAALYFNRPSDKLKKPSPAGEGRTAIAVDEVSAESRRALDALKV